MFSKEQVEYLHNTGKMPDWVYYQQNGNGITENYREQKAKIDQRIIQDIERKQQGKEMERCIQESIEEVIQKSMIEILKNIRIEQ